MSPKQLREVLRVAGWTQLQLATALDLNERTVRRYVSGELPLPKVTVLAIRWLQEAGVLER